MKRCIAFLSVLMSVFVLTHGQTYKTEPVSTEIRTILIHPNGDWTRYPVTGLNSGDYMQLVFDRMGEDSYGRLAYKIIHCNADWTPSSLSDIEYIDGFNDNVIEDYAYSVSTTVEYTNFRLRIPNDDIRLTLSGNYVIQVYEEDNRDNVLLTACFSIVDEKIGLGGEMSANTLIDAYREHQQISFTINTSGLNIRDPFTDLKIYVRQNDRLDNQKSDIKPTSVQVNKLVYNNNRNLIFEAGNEYRRFETPSSRYNGLRIYNIEYRRPFYYANIIPDKIRAYTRYIYDEDQNGKFFIRNVDGNDSDVDGDYFFVNFRLEADDPLDENVYVNGNFTNDMFDETYLMQYDYDNRMYYTTLMLKQGVYNYQYLTEANGKYSAAPVEGNYYETENEYQIFVYYRLPGQWYDSLIGYLKLGK